MPLLSITERDLREPPLHVYELFEGPEGPNNLSRWYGAYSSQLWQVAASSLKQALYSATHDLWSDGKSAGLIAYQESDDKQWFYFDGSFSWRRRYRAGRVFPPKHPLEESDDDV